MIFNKDTASKTAELLLQINAIKLNPGKTWIAVYPENRKELIEMNKEIKTKEGKEKE